jgi:hypothetical protein
MRQWIVAGEAHFQMLAAMMMQCLSTVMMKVPGSCYGVAEVPLPRPGVSCLSSSPPITRPQLALQAGGRG